MLEDVLTSINNFFVRERVEGEFYVKDGSLSMPYGSIANGQWFTVDGSVFNDGLHKWPCELSDEEFSGCVCLCAVPQAVIDLADEIEAWQNENGSMAASPMQSESFDGYSYSLASQADRTWQAAFRGRLNRWRKL